MLKLPKYLIASNRAELPSPLILSTCSPFMVGQVWSFKDPYEFITMVNNYKGIGLSTVTGYQILITFEGVFTGNKMQITNPLNIKGDVKKVLDEMAEFYLSEKIQSKQSFYKKYLL
jgi:hypothetical protein